MKPKMIVAIVLAVLLLGAGAYLAYGFFFSGATDDALTLVPDDAIGYFNVFLSPSNSQKRALEDLIAKTPFESPEEAIKKFTDLIDEGLKEQGCSFEEDFDPWLGKQVAGFLTEAGDDGQGAILVSADDEDAAMAALEKCAGEEFEEAEQKTYEGTEYRFQDDGAVGTVEGHLVVGTEGAFKQVVDTAAGGDSLEGSDKFEDALEPLTSDRLGVFYLDIKALLDQLEETGEADPAEVAAAESFYGIASDRPLSAALSVRSDAIVFEFATGLPEGQEAAETAEEATASDLLGELPGGSWGAVAIGSFGDYLDRILDLSEQFGAGDRALLEAQFEEETGLSLSEDVLAWMGDLGIFVQGTTPLTLSGGVVIETEDVAAAQSAVDTVADLAAQEGAPVKPLRLPGAEGFYIQAPDQPQPINVVVGNDRLVVAYGNVATEQALEADVTLAEESDTFAAAAEALGEDFAMAGFFDADPIQSLVEESVLPTLTTFDPETFQTVPNTEAQETYEQDVKPFVDPLSFIAFGSRVEDGVSTSRIIVGVE